MPTSNGETTDASRRRIQFGMMSVFVATTWVACITFLLLNTVFLVAILGILLVTLAIYEATLLVSARATFRDRIYSAIKVAIVLLVLVAMFTFAALSDMRRIVFQPMYNRAERGRMVVLTRALAQDARFANVKVSLSEFKGFQSMHVEGTVPNAYALEDLNQLLTVGVEPISSSVAIEGTGNSACGL